MKSTKNHLSGWNDKDSLNTIYLKFSDVNSKLSHYQSKGMVHSGSSSGLCNPSKYGWAKHSFTVYLLAGLNVTMWSNKSKAKGLAFYKC